MISVQYLHKRHELTAKSLVPDLAKEALIY
jgi:hypothetical protein